MRQPSIIPAVGLFGETDHFPDLVHCEDLSARAPMHDWRISAHRHAQMSQLFLLEDGWMKAKVDGEVYSLENGDFLYIPEHCVHELSFRAETRGRVYSFPLSIAVSLGPSPSDVLNLLTRPIMARASPKLLRGTEILNDGAQTAGPLRAQQIVAMAHYVLSCVGEIRLGYSREEVSPHHDRMHRLDGLIAQHLGSGWGASDYARALSMTTGHLSRLCREATGRGVASYLEQKTMNEASRLLAFTQLSVAEIGYRVGYGDPSYFSKRFRAARGQTPSQYRARFTR